MAGQPVAGEMYETITGQLFEIGRQIRQKSGYPHDPEKLKDHLQAAIEGRFSDAGGQSVSVQTPTSPAAEESSLSCGSAEAQLDFWVGFCREKFGIAIDKTRITIPPKPEGEYRLFVGTEAVGFELVMDLYKRSGRTLMLESFAPKNLRHDRSDITYAGWVFDSTSGDPSLVGKSYNSLSRKMRCVSATEIALLNFVDLENGKTFDPSDVVMCAGTMVSSGHVVTCRVGRSGTFFGRCSTDDSSEQMAVKRIYTA